MSIDAGPPQMGGPPRRSYIPPHMRGQKEVVNGAPMNGPGPVPGSMPGPAPAVNGLNQSAWAG